MPLVHLINNQRKPLFGCKVVVLFKVQFVIKSYTSWVRLNHSEKSDGLGGFAQYLGGRFQAFPVLKQVAETN